MSTSQKEGKGAQLQEEHLTRKNGKLFLKNGSNLRRQRYGPNLHQAKGSRRSPAKRPLRKLRPMSLPPKQIEELPLGPAAPRLSWDFMNWDTYASRAC